MFGLSSIAAKLIGAAALVAVLGGVGLWLVNAIEGRALARAALHQAIEANASLIAERDRARVDAAAESERAIARQRERDTLAASVAALRQRLSDASNTCVLPDGDLDAIDRFLRGEQ